MLAEIKTIKGIKMASGGYRVNSGRKKGSLSKKTTAIAELATANNQTPLEYLISVYTNTEVPRQERVAAAMAAAPYVHAKLSSMPPNETKPVARVPIQIVGVPPNGFVLDAAGNLLRQIDGEALRIESHPDAH